MQESMRNICLGAFAFAVVAVAVAVVPFISQAENLKPGDFVAVIGDSITEQKDYSVNIEDYLLMCQPAAGLKAMQFGWGGETAEGFKNRMVNDCFRYAPAVATTCYGMNDGAYGPMDAKRAQWYHDNQRAVVQGMKKAGVRFIVVGSPGAVDLNKFSGGNKEKIAIYNKTLAEERDIAKTVAEEEGVAFANVYDPMYDAMTKAIDKYGPQYHVCGGDGVHPAHNGHLIMAYAFLKALGCDGNIGTITLDLAGTDATATDGHKVLSKVIANHTGSVEIESTRYPFCFTGGNPADPNSQRGILEFIPFNQDLNRLTLIVKGGAGKLKVTWGNASKEFDADQLAKGINLAAEFLDNPFSAAFASVHQKAQNQQNYETPMIKTWVHGLPQFKAELPEDADCFEKIIADMGKKDQKLIGESSAALSPVKHTIKVETVN
jgi:lysophospholipase L1-like esterase